MSKLQSRYVGARPFETDQQLIFKGRQTDTEAVFRLLQLENLTVLYGKSGTGKSSLLNAGIIPKVKAETEMLPVRVRFNAYKEGNTFTPPAETARLSVRSGVSGKPTFLHKLIADENTLWQDVKEHFIRHEGQKGLLLVIDQFEELFTYPATQVQVFAEQLAEALFKTVPQRYWDVLETGYAEGKNPLGPEELSLLQHKPALKVVLSIRSDRLHLLNRLDEQLPVILKNLYELDALSPDAARQAITEPAAMPKMDWFDSEPFLYDPAAIEHILDFLTLEASEAAQRSDGVTDSHPVTTQETTLPSEAVTVSHRLTETRHLQKIEATQLQIILAEVEKRAQTNGLRMVQVAHLGDLGIIIEQYYSNQILQLDPAEQLPARRFIEEGLVFEEEERRLSIYEGQIFKTYKIQPDTLRKLVDAHLLRAEPSLSGGYTYELSHDTLVAPVLKAKRIRVEEERREEESRLTRMREEELEEARAEALQEKKRRQRATMLTRAAIICLVATFGASVFAGKKAQVAEKATRQAESALRQALEEKIQRYDLEINASQRKIETYAKAKEPELVELETAQMKLRSAQRDSAKVQIQQIDDNAGL